MTERDARLEPTSQAARIERVGRVDIDAISIPPPPPVPRPTAEESLDELLVDLMKTPPEMAELIPSRVRDVDQEAMLARVCNAFPGPLWFDRRRPHRKMPRGAHVSALGALIAGLGETSVPYLAWLLGSEEPDIRYYAALVCSEVPDGRLFRPLWQVALGADIGARQAAVQALRAHRALPDYPEVLRSLRHLATTTTTREAWRVRALEALSQLGDGNAAGDMIELLGDKNRTVARAAHGALVTLTGHDLGAMRSSWRGWLGTNGRRDRIEWLIDALEDRRSELRVAAWRELERISGHRYGLSEEAPRDAFLVARERYAAWWRERRA